MAGFADFAAITTARDAGKVIHYDFVKSVPGITLAQLWTRLWVSTGLPGAGAEPAGTPGAAVTNEGIFFPATSTDRKILTKIYAVASSASGFTSGTLMLHDRLVGVGAISFTSTGDKTVSSAALTRYTDGVGVQPWLEITTSLGGADASATVTLNSYTNQGGTPGRNSTTDVVLGTDFNTGTCVPFPLLTGDTGVQAVSTINVSDAASAGAASLVLVKPLAYLPLIADVPVEIDLILELSAFQRVFDGASLGMYVFSNSTNIATITGYIELVYG